jgi:hypothetical protein
MTIHYLQVHDGTKLFSFNRHDFKEYKDKDDNYFMIDGGFDYIKYSMDKEKGEIKYGEVKDLIEDIRKQFTWGQNYAKDGTKLEKTLYKKLHELDFDHILGILRYFTINLDKQAYSIDRNWAIVHLIFIEELLYRQRNN